MNKPFFSVLLLLILCSGLKSETVDTINIKVSSRGHIILPVSIDGKQNGYMVFDTGASKTCLQLEVAEKLNLKKLGNVTVNYAGKNEKAIQPIVSLGSMFSIGNLSFRNLTAYGIDLSHNDHYNCDSVFGIIGMDIIRLGVWEFLLDQNIVIFNKSFNYTTKDLKEYKSIKLHTKGRGGRIPYVFVKTSRWGKNRFLFDTGFNGSLNIKYSELSNFPKRIAKANGKSLSITGLKVSKPSDFETGYLKNIKIGNVTLYALQYIADNSQFDLLGVNFLNNSPFIFDGKSLTLYIRESSAEISDNWDKYPFRVRLLNGEIVVTTIIFDDTNPQNSRIRIGDRIIEVNGESIYSLTNDSCERYEILSKMFENNSIRKVKFITPEGDEYYWELDFN